MTQEKNLLAKATEALANTEVPPGPPQEVVDATLTKLASANESRSLTPDPCSGIKHRASSIVHFIRFAAAAVFLIASGYMIGRLSAPKAMDAGELYTALKPAIQRDLLEPMGQQWQLILAGNNAELKDQMQADFRQQMNEFAIRTLTASGAVTNQYLKELVQSINASQMENRRWLASALQQIELDRIRDKAQLANGIETLAVATGDELQRTKDDIVQFLAYKQPAGLNPNVYEGPNTTSERSRQ
jgi:hypothetical protein